MSKKEIYIELLKKMYSYWEYAGFLVLMLENNIVDISKIEELFVVLKKTIKDENLKNKLDVLISVNEKLKEIKKEEQESKMSEIELNNILKLL